jgi:hypothetical protein
MITMRLDHAEEVFSSVLCMDKGQPYSIAISLMPISLSQQIPHALHKFLNLEAGVNNVGRGSEDDEFSPFSSVLCMDKGQPYAVAISLMPISLSQQIPRALRKFLNLEAGVNNVGRGSEDDEFRPLTIPRIIFYGAHIYIYVDGFIGPC